MYDACVPDRAYARVRSQVLNLTTISLCVMKLRTNPRGDVHEIDNTFLLQRKLRAAENTSRIHIKALSLLPSPPLLILNICMCAIELSQAPPAHTRHIWTQACTRPPSHSVSSGPVGETPHLTPTFPPRPQNCILGPHSRFLFFPMAEARSLARNWISADRSSSNFH